MIRIALSAVSVVLLVACLAVHTGHLKAGADASALSAAALRVEGEAQAGGGHGLLFRVINFALLAGGLAYLLRKPLGEFFAQRTVAIKKSLDEGRQALEASGGEMRAVEEKLARLEEEIAAFRAASLKEMEEERERLRRAAAEEAGKMLQAMRAQMEMATAAALLDLKRYAAEQALHTAEELIRQRLDGVAHERLVSRFLEELRDRKAS